jgi:hypothetical protein
MKRIVFVGKVIDNVLLIPRVTFRNTANFRNIAHTAKSLLLLERFDVDRACFENK